LEKGRAHEISDVLLLESDQNIEERKETLPFLLYFLLVTRVKVTSSISSTSAAISTLDENIRTRLEL